MAEKIKVEFIDHKLDNTRNETPYSTIFLHEVEDNILTVEDLCFVASEKKINPTMKVTARTNIIFRGEDGKFISWKKLGPIADLSNIPAFPSKKVH